MSQSTIRETVDTALGGRARGYEQYVAPVVSALEAREHAMADAALSIAQSRGLSSGEARSAVEQIGLTFRPAPAPVASSNGASEGSAPIGEEIENLLTGMRNLFDRLTR